MPLENKFVVHLQMHIEIALFDLLSVPSWYPCALFIVNERRISLLDTHQRVIWSMAMLWNWWHLRPVPQTWSSGALSSSSVWANVPGKPGMPCVGEVREKGKDFTFLLLVPTSGTRSQEVGREDGHRVLRTVCLILEESFFLSWLDWQHREPEESDWPCQLSDKNWQLVKPQFFFSHFSTLQ